MRRGLAIAALTAGLLATTLPAAAQNWGHGGWGWNHWGGSGFGVSVGFGSPWYGAYAAAPGFGGCRCPSGAFAYAPGHAYAGYAYAPGYEYGPGFGWGHQSFGFDTGPRAGFAVGGEFREGVRSRTVIRSGVRERGMMRVGARDDAMIRGSVRDRSSIRAQGQVGGRVATGSTIRTEGTTGMRARARASANGMMGGDATVGRGGGRASGQAGGAVRY